MKQKNKYDNADIEIIRLKMQDVVTTSDTYEGNGKDSDDDGWTSVGGGWA